jgi:hypothetical protein
MAVRALLLCLAVAAVAVGASSLRTDHRCTEASRAVDHATPATAAAIAREIGDRCGDTRIRVDATAALFVRSGRPGALELARRMTRANPDDYLGWLAVWRLSGDRGALARVRELNPRLERP